MLTRALTVALLSFAYAHSGFNTLAWGEAWGAYTVTVLEDFDVTEGEQGTGELLVQLSDGEEVVPDATQVEAVIRHRDALVYEGEVSYLTQSSADGETSYVSYHLALPLSQAGLYRLELTLSGPLGTVNRAYAVRTQQGAPSALEYLPSVLILAIVLGGAALLFIPLPRTSNRKDTHETPSRLSPHD